MQRAGTISIVPSEFAMSASCSTIIRGAPVRGCRARPPRGTAARHFEQEPRGQPASAASNEILHTIGALTAHANRMSVDNQTFLFSLGEHASLLRSWITVREGGHITKRRIGGRYGFQMKQHLTIVAIRPGITRARRRFDRDRKTVPRWQARCRAESLTGLVPPYPPRGVPAP